MISTQASYLFKTPFLVLNSALVALVTFSALAVFFAFPSYASVNAEKHNSFVDAFQISTIGEISTAGTLSIQDEPLIGVGLRYFYKKVGNHSFYIEGNYITDLENVGGSVDVFGMDFGGQYSLPRFWGRRNYFEYSLGATYTSEEYQFNLLDRNVTNSYNEFGVNASIGYGVDFTSNFGSAMSINQYGNDSTTIGLKFYYSF